MRVPHGRGGRLASVVANVSDATHETTNGFGLPYGDCDTVAINSAGKIVAVTGEGDTSQLHGDIWVNGQT